MSVLLIFFLSFALTCHNFLSDSFYHRLCPAEFDYYRHIEETRDWVWDTFFMTEVESLQDAEGPGHTSRCVEYDDV